MRRLQRLQAGIPVALRQRLQRCFRQNIGPATAAKLWRCRVADAVIVFKTWRQLRIAAARSRGVPVRKVRRPHRMAVWPGSYVGPRRGLPAHEARPLA